MRIIREEHPSPQGPAVVALTASAMSGDKELALQNGFHVRYSRASYRVLLSESVYRTIFLSP